MMFLAERRGSVPKDLGLDLLLFKEKRWREEYYSHKIEEGVKIIQAKTDTNFKPDKSGWFKIQIDREENKIIAIHYLIGEQTPNMIIKGETAEEVYQTINRNELISKLDHAAYLGVELTKAEIALNTGRGYLQDSSLF
jgi:dihydropteroate synthase-like protein